MALDYVITGTGGCGTAWLAEVLNKAGYRAGHERVFNALDIKYDLAKKIDIEISYATAPYLRGLGNVIDSTTKIVHLVRNPYEVIRTWIAKSGYQNYFKGSGAHPRFVRNVLPGIVEYNNPVDSGIYYYVKWNKMIDPYRDELVRLEDIGTWLQSEFKPQVMKETLVSLAKNVAKVNVGTNSRYFVIDFTKADKDLYTELLDMVEGYGYKII